MRAIPPILLTKEIFTLSQLDSTCLFFRILSHFLVKERKKCLIRRFLFLLHTSILRVSRFMGNHETVFISQCTNQKAKIATIFCFIRFFGAHSFFNHLSSVLFKLARIKIRCRKTERRKDRVLWISDKQTDRQTNEFDKVRRVNRSH